jgi:hypothetical protein
VAAWPSDDGFARRCFELLRQAYVKARYSLHYATSDDELRWLGERIEVLHHLVRDVSRDQIDAVDRNTGA